MGLDQSSLDRFRQRVAFFRASPMSKLLGAPARMGYSAAMRAWCHATHRAVRSTARTFWGDEMNIVFPELGSLAIYRYNFIEEGLTSIFLSQVQPGMTVFDIGAHFGYFTLLAASLVGTNGQVHSFEPTPSTFEILRANTAAKSNVRANNLALFSRSEDIAFQDFGIEYSQWNAVGADRMNESLRQRVQARSCVVKAMRLDDYADEAGARPAFIKIDAENAELEILKGASRVLQDLRPTITIEVGDYDAQHPELHPIGYLGDRGYRVLEYSSGSLRVHKPRADYPYDNLVFVPEERVDAAIEASASLSSRPT